MKGVIILAENHGLSQDLINELKKIATVSNVRKICLFGSRARGDFHIKSDIDLAIDASGFKPAKWAELKEQIQEGLPTLLKIDIIRLDSASPELISNIELDGVVIYERH